MMLLDDVRKVMTKKILLSLKLEQVTYEFATFLEKNVKTHPGTTELTLVVGDEDAKMAVRMKTQNSKIELNDELIQYLQAHEEIQYVLEKS
jgi:DNA polymerase-3 subunit alpha